MRVARKLENQGSVVTSMRPGQETPDEVRLFEAEGVALEYTSMRPGQETPDEALNARSFTTWRCALQ